MTARRGCGLAALLLAAPWPLSTGAPPQPALLATPVHLGVAGQPEWAHFVGRTPAARSLTLDFTATTNRLEHTLLIRQSDVKQVWSVTLNDAPIGTLVPMEADLVQSLVVPPGRLRDGRNTLQIESKAADDIVLHEITLVPAPTRELLARSHLEVDVRDERGAPLPARVTVIDERGFLTPLAGEPAGRVAVRPGVAYVGVARARLGLQPGTYRLRATRGPEYGADDVTLTVRDGETAGARFMLRREVTTDGWAAADTHIHTSTLSGHGDATLHERALTLAGEGIELAVATEHDRVADYADALRVMGVADFVTPVAGNEVTTPRGHFNVIGADDSWAILNHPHDVHAGFTPFARPHFDSATGAVRGLTRDFQAIEVVNSGAMRSDWLQPIRSWFAVMDRLGPMTPIGASDSHDVARFIVGQGRTYVKVADHAPGRIDGAGALAALRRGEVVVSLGLFVDVTVDEVGPGGMVHGRRRDGADEPGAAPPSHRLRARISGPAWVEADRVAVYVNGNLMREQSLTPAPRTVEKGEIVWTLPPRADDYHVVVIASGPGVTHPSWGMARPYQPSSLEWAPAAIAVSGPIRVDADGDRAFSSASDYARRVLAAHASLRDIVGALAAHDQAVATHVAEQLAARGEDLRSAALAAALEAAAPQVRRGIEQYRAGR